MSDGPQPDPGQTQPVQPPEGTRPMPSSPWQVPPSRPRQPNGEYDAQPPAPPHYPPGQYPTTPPPYSGPQYPGQYFGSQGYGYPVPGPAVNSPRGQAIAALVVNIALVVFTCLFALPSIAGLIIAAVAIGNADSDPNQARTLLKWSWGLAITTGALVLLFVIGVVAFGLVEES